MIDITVLGTSCMVPTKDRNASATYAEIRGVGMLFDCGEGTQRQMNIAGINRLKVRYIFISHWHADHTAGLLGLIQTMGQKPDGVLDIYGPKGSGEMMDHLMKASIHETHLEIHVHEYDLNMLTKLISTDDFIVRAINLDHGIPCIGFRLEEVPAINMQKEKLLEDGLPEGPLWAQLQKGHSVEHDGIFFNSEDYIVTNKGKVFTYIADTRFTQNSVILAKNADVILSEASYCDEHEHKADEYKHQTASQAAQVASMADAEQLYLTHFSQRYKDVTQLVQEAQVIFPETAAAFDFMKIVLK
jgi:ribonuclease Z